jgi:uncharacterized membrane protein
MISTATVQFYDVIVFVHILAVVVGFGPTFAYALFAAVAGKEGLRASLAVERAILKWNMTGTTFGMLVILASGLYLVSDGPWSLSDFFISWGFLAILLLFGLVHGYFLPRERKLITGLEAEADAAPDRTTPRSDKLAALDAQVARMGTVAGITIILTIYVMTAKPFL